LKPQNFEKKNLQIREEFELLRKRQPDRFKKRLNFSWSNWGFGAEPLEQTAKRLSDNGLKYIELHGNRYGKDLGYKSSEVKKILDNHGLKTAGICGMFSSDNDMASNRGIVRQHAIDYIRRNIELGSELGAKYFLIVPAAVGRAAVIDDMEFERSVETLQKVGDIFKEHNIRGAVEPIRSAEVSIIHTFADAEKYIEKVNSPGIQHINGDLYHMLTEESHIPETICKYGKRLTNLHLADTNRCALGDGSMDIDTLIMALYLIGYNNEFCYCTAEPLGPGGDPYPAMYGKTDPEILDELVNKSVKYWREREEMLVI